jgi:hypothetical protein
VVFPVACSWNADSAYVPMFLKRLSARIL